MLQSNYSEDHPEVDASKLGLLKAAPPKAPTPFKLYSDSRINKLVAEGKSKVEAREVCREEYKDLSEKQKVKWILLSLKAENAYDVSPSFRSIIIALISLVDQSLNHLYDL